MKPTLNQFTYHLYTAQSRPELWSELKDDNHPLNKAWPLYLDQDVCYQQYCSRLAQYDGLREYQFAMVEQGLDGEEAIVACARSIPFYWPELDQPGLSRQDVLQTLPDGGYDAILTRGVQQYQRRQSQSQPTTKNESDHHETSTMTDDPACAHSDPPNALSAISITVHPDRRSAGLAEAMIHAMKQTAKSKQLQILVVPLRPTRKFQHPSVDMADYITWTQQPPVPDRDLPFDPWLRKHVRLGAQIVKVARTSMRVEGTIADWRRWTRCEEWQTRPVQWDSCPLFVDVEFPGGLVPLRVYLQEDRAVYLEPNVWLYHDIYA